MAPDHVKAQILALWRWVARQDTSQLVYAASMIAIIVAVLFVFFTKTSLPTRLNKDNPLLLGNVERFYKDCVDRVLRFGDVPQGCRTAKAMYQEYHVNVWDVMNEQRLRMIYTARMIARGDLMTEADYQACVARAECHIVPLLPGINQNDEKRMSNPDIRAKQDLFWHLVNDGSLRPDLCEYMDVCKALRKIGLIKFAEKG